MRSSISIAMAMAVLAKQVLTAECGQWSGGSPLDYTAVEVVIYDLCTNTGRGGIFTVNEDTTSGEAETFGGACPNDCYDALYDILNQCLAKSYNTDTWDAAGQWYWLWSELS